jgi:hypothetical protein
VSKYQQRRGIEANRLAVTPLDGELILITDTQKLWYGDGATPGGIEFPSGGGGATESTITQAAHGFAVLDAVRFTGAEWVKAQADDISTTALGIVVAVIDANTFVFAMSGRYEIGLLAAGQWYYLDAAAAGNITATEPTISQPIVYAEDGSWIVIYPYRPSYTIPPSAPIVGEMKPFFGLLSALPFGWHLCDGTNGTPDTRGRVLYGADGGDYVEGTSGGAKAVDRDVDTNGAHTHSTTSDVHSHSFSDAHTHGVSITSAFANKDHSHSNTGAVGVTAGTDGFAWSTALSSSQNGSGHSHVVSGNTESGTASGTTGSDTHSHTANSNGDHDHSLTDDDPLHFVVTGYIMYTGVA